MILESPVKWGVSLYNGKGNLVNVCINLLLSDKVRFKVITLSDLLYYILTFFDYIGVIRLILWKRYFNKNVFNFRIQVLEAVVDYLLDNRDLICIQQTGNDLITHIGSLLEVLYSSQLSNSVKQAMLFYSYSLSSYLFL